MVHVCSHLRQRHIVLTVKTFASVSIALPLQNGHSVGRVTVSVSESFMLFCPFSGAQGGLTAVAASRAHDDRISACTTIMAAFSTLRLFKSEQP